MPEILRRRGTQSPAAAAETQIDFSTLAGLALALAGILGGLLLERGKLQDVVQVTAAFIVLGGTFGAVLVTTPFPVIRRAARGAKYVFLERKLSFGAVSDHFVRYAVKARRNGLLSLETDAEDTPDPFLGKALRLVVDGTDMEAIRRIMENDMALREQAAEEEAKVWETAGGYAPTIGIIGAVMGLIQVMKDLENIQAVGHGIAVAFVATVYGVGSANILFLPAANKLRARMKQQTLLMEMTLLGVEGIVEGLNPILIRLKLEPYESAGSGVPASAARAPRPPAVSGISAAAGGRN